MERPQRKRLRLESYDYSQPGSYFITICTRERNQEVLCSIEPAVGAIINRPPRISLTPLGWSWMKPSERSRITTPAYR